MKNHPWNETGRPQQSAAVRPRLGPIDFEETTSAADDPQTATRDSGSPDCFECDSRGGVRPFLDRDVLSLNEVAIILRCTRDTVRRIPRDELYVYRGPGRARLYLREDLKRYLRQRRIVQ